MATCSRAEYLVVDTGPLLKGASLTSLATKLFTVPEVVAEVRDQKSRAILDTLELTVRTPSEEAMQAIIRFSKLTGDFASLSLPDLRVLALAYMLEKERNGVAHLKVRPDKVASTAKGKAPVLYVGGRPVAEQTLSSAIANEEERAAEAESEVTATTAVAKEGEEEEEEEELSDSDDDDWITPENVNAHKMRDYGYEADSRSLENKQVDVACLTTDFAMQNVLLQMGLNLISVDGVLIKRVKTWVLRCHACFKITTDMERQFCPTCGNNTLTRVSASTDENGNLCVFLKRNFQHNVRGTRYSIPKYKGGKHGNDMILREDERAYQVAVHRNRRKAKQDVFDPDYIPALMQGDSGRMAKNSMPTIGYGRRNPNASRRGGRSKRR
ncbi:Nin one binding Zn-ribbon like-domain-containing protein [Thamnocephalis sphaerospora]|uniref:20S-pre-rRNA D-site endonuclease NOB1 n=1 Tax=Thamnocephalis sphaerospora TaxID=78915 RepID=A0A4P9XTT5_9FUNG|nr:Nin one binding Zn-ribbon like-domain-containing protein [Thamnocephalis sphaerospora]|eukprot:RKP09402.1 Nin one binding Zn-ribbon like-domain-containing protein [Thamnocephalis sphaerospora]